MTSPPGQEEDMQTTTEGPAGSNAGQIGTGIRFPQLGTECPEAATDFARAAEAVAERYEFNGERGVTAEPFADWTFHYIGAGRWVARVAPYRESDPLYVEWNGHVGRWDDARVHSTIEFLQQEETHPLRFRPRGTIPREPA